MLSSTFTGAAASAAKALHPAAASPVAVFFNFALGSS